jgi:hypothetical protein
MPTLPYRPLTNTEIETLRRLALNFALYLATKQTTRKTNT